MRILVHEACSMPSLSTRHFLCIVRASAVYDLLVTAPFATPWSFELLSRQLSAINQSLGGASLPAFGVFHVLIACLLGSLVMVWSVLRLVQPSIRLGRFDGAARGLFVTWMAWALALSGAPVLWLFIVPEAAWGLMQWLPIASPGSGHTDPAIRRQPPESPACFAPAVLP